MSSLRTLLCGLLGVVTVTSVLAAQQPLDTIGPIEKQSNPITPENPIPRRSYSIAPVYPADARGIDGTATVTLVATLDATGRVVEIRKARDPLVMSPAVPAPTPTALRVAAEGFVREAAGALSRWQYDPPARAPISFSVSFLFKPGLETVSTQTTTTGGNLSSGIGGLPAPPAAPGGPNQPIRVGGQIKAPSLVKKVEPVYPQIAQSARVSGVVIGEVTVGADGRVTEVKILRSVPLLDQAAIDAVRQWEYTPTLLNGAPTPVIMTVTVAFTLPPTAQ